MNIFKNLFKKEKETDKKKIVFHIGRPKTGSKAVQFFLYDNKDILKKNSILYPESILHEKFHHLLVWSLKNINKDLCPEKPEYYFNLLKKEFEESNCDTCILSSEDASIGSNLDYCQKLKDMLDDYDVKIVVYLRRQDYALESSYNQSVKNSAVPFSGTIHDYLQLDLDLDYYSFLEPWSTAFGIENICVRTYEKMQMKDGVVVDFVEFLGLNIIDFRYEEKKVNPSLDRDALEIVRRINKYNLPFQSRVMLMRKVRQLINRAKKDDEKISYHSLLSPLERQDILSQYNESNELIAKQYLDRKELFFEKWDENNDKWQEYKGLSVELMVKVLIELWKEFYKLKK